jgi:hypothetical protein
MWCLKRDILNYAQVHNSLPPTLKSLPPNLVGDLAKDAWGKDIEYKHGSNDIVILTSHPPDGPAIVRSFHAKTPKGTWAKYSDEFWIEIPLALKSNAGKLQASPQPK